MLRLDNISHILAWSGKECESLGEAAPVELVELPRVGLTFYVNENGKKYNCVEHTGLYVSNFRDKDIHKMMRSLPHSILMQTVRGELFVLLPALAMPVPFHAKEDLISSGFALDRTKSSWLKNLGSTRHYLYEVHSSRRYIYSKTLSGTLYLMLLRFCSKSTEML